jgi:hypothetical protein
MRSPTRRLSQLEAIISSRARVTTSVTPSCQTKQRYYATQSASSCVCRVGLQPEQ